MRKSINHKVMNVIEDLISDGLVFTVESTANIVTIEVIGVTIDRFKDGNFEGCISDPVQTDHGVLIQIPTYF